MIKQHGQPEKVAIDKGGANISALNEINQDIRDNNEKTDSTDEEIEVRQSKYLNNIIEQDHRGIKRITKPMMNFKSFNSARQTLAGIELIRMLKKGQMKAANKGDFSPTEQFYLLAS